MVFYSVAEDRVPYSWNHAFIFKDKGNHTEIRIYRFAFQEEKLLKENRSAYYMFDWISAIKRECDARNIGTIIKQR